MNDAHLHLLVNHLPIVGSIFTLTLMGLALVLSSQRRGVFLAATTLALLTGITSVMADVTGDGAEEMVEDMPDVRESLIHEHEERADAALALGILTAVVSVGSLAATWRREKIPALAVAFSGVAALATVGAMARAGQAGGLIRHTEIRDDGTGMKKEEEEEGEEEEREEAHERSALPTPAPAVAPAPTTGNGQKEAEEAGEKNEAHERNEAREAGGH